MFDSYIKLLKSIQIYPNTMGYKWDCNRVMWGLRSDSFLFGFLLRGRVYLSKTLTIKKEGEPASNPLNYDRLVKIYPNIVGYTY